MQNEGSVVTSDERGSSPSIAQHSPLFRTHLDAEWVCGWSIPLSDMPLFVNQELGEVPLDVFTEGTGFAGFQKLVDGRSIFAVDINLTGKIKEMH